MLKLSVRLVSLLKRSGYRPLYTVLVITLLFTATSAHDDDQARARHDDVTETAKPENSENFQSKPNMDINPWEIYHKLLQQKRKSHLEAVKAILNLGGYEKKYKMVKLLMEKMVAVLTESKTSLIQLGFSPGDAFPTKQETQEALSRVAENTAFFGDILLRLPDITHDLLNRNREWELMAKWSVGFCNESKILQGADKKLLDLVGQELGVIDRSPDYVNPYKVDVDNTEKKLQDVLEKLDDSKKNDKSEKKKKKPKIKKGPRLSNVRHNEL